MIDTNDLISLDSFKPGAASNAEPTDRRDRVDQCKVIWYQWDNDLLTEPGTGAATDVPLPPGFEHPNLDKATAYDISDHLTHFTYAKSLDGAAGSFSMTLGNTIEWQRYMKPGTWIVVYLSKEGDLLYDTSGGGASNTQTIGESILNGFPGVGSLKGSVGEFSSKPSDNPDLDLGPDATTHKGWALKGYRRCIGIIQRVALKSHTTIDGAVDIEFVISGKDFGAVFEETELWFNMWTSEKGGWASLSHAMKLPDRNLRAAMDLFYDVFFNPDSLEALKGNRLKAVRILGEKSKQWLIPSKMRDDLFLDAKYFGQISTIKDFKPTLFEIQEGNPLAGAEGLAWEHLKGISEPSFHEMFTELDDLGAPKVIFRPIPWAFDKTGYPNMGELIPTYRQHFTGGFVPAIKPRVGQSIEIIQSIRELLGTPSGTAMASRFDLDTVDIESFNLGPAFHERYNFFLADFAQNSNYQTTAIIALQKLLTASGFPLQNRSDIQRHGFKPMLIQIQALLTNIGAVTLLGASETKSPNLQFVLEANYLLKDYHGNAEDFHSGTLSIAGNHKTKIGKIVKTDKQFPGLGEMAFYVEGYSDNFSIDVNGTGEWNQVLEVTRGIEVTDLLGPVESINLNTKSLDNEIVAHTGTFHKDRK